MKKKHIYFFSLINKGSLPLSLMSTPLFCFLITERPSFAPPPTPAPMTVSIAASERDGSKFRKGLPLSITLFKKCLGFVTFRPSISLDKQVWTFFSEALVLLQTCGICPFVVMRWRSLVVLQYVLSIAMPSLCVTVHYWSNPTKYRVDAATQSLHVCHHL